MEYKENFKEVPIFCEPEGRKRALGKVYRGRTVLERYTSWHDGQMREMHRNYWK